YLSTVTLFPYTTLFRSSIFSGAVIAWFIALPLASHFVHHWLHAPSLSEGGMALWNSQLRYLGIGAMLFAGFWTFAKLLRPLLRRSEEHTSELQSPDHLV